MHHYQHCHQRCTIISTVTIKDAPLSALSSKMHHYQHCHQRCTIIWALSPSKMHHYLSTVTKDAPLSVLSPKMHHYLHCQCHHQRCTIIWALSPKMHHYQHCHHQRQPLVVTLNDTLPLAVTNNAQPLVVTLNDTLPLVVTNNAQPLAVTMKGAPLSVLSSSTVHGHNEKCYCITDVLQTTYNYIMYAWTTWNISITRTKKLHHTHIALSQNNHAFIPSVIPAQRLCRILTIPSLSRTQTKNYQLF